MRNPGGFSDRQLAKNAIAILIREDELSELGSQTMIERANLDPKDERARLADLFDCGMLPSSFSREELADPVGAIQKLMAVAQS